MHKGNVIAVEPNIDSFPKMSQGQELVKIDVAYQKADIHVMLVDHKEFKKHKPDKGLIIDTKGIWKLERLEILC